MPFVRSAPFVSRYNPSRPARWAESPTMTPTFINLTPHALSVHTPDGGITVLPRTRPFARVATVSVPAAPVGGIPTVTTTFGEVTCLPEPLPGVILVVSGMVASAAPRPDVMSPGDLVRDDDGKPIGCRGLRRSC